MDNSLFSRVFAILIIVAIAGCISFSGRNSGEVSEVSQVEEIETRYLRILAAHLGVELVQKRTAEDLVTDIKLAMDDAIVSVPPPFDAKIINSLKLCLSEAEGRHLDEVNEMLKRLYTPDVYVFPRGMKVP